MTDGMKSYALLGEYQPFSAINASNSVFDMGYCTGPCSTRLAGKPGGATDEDTSRAASEECY